MKQRRAILVAGYSGAGKTTYSNKLKARVKNPQRVVVLQPGQPYRLKKLKKK